MTKKERAVIEEALKELRPEGDYQRGMALLYGLLGEQYPVYELRFSGEAIPVSEVPVRRATRPTHGGSDADE